MHINLNNVLTIGDPNARTGGSSDYIWNTTALDNVSDDVGATELINMYSLQHNRRSQDAVKNNFGHALIDLCISLRLLIVNSRVDNWPVNTLALLRRRVFFHGFVIFMLVNLMN